MWKKKLATFPFFHFWRTINHEKSIKNAVRRCENWSLPMTQSMSHHLAHLRSPLKLKSFFLCVSHVNMIIKHVENHEKNFSVSARIFRIVPHRPSSSLNKIAVPLAIFPRPSNSVYIIYSEFEGIWGISTRSSIFPRGNAL